MPIVRRNDNPIGPLALGTGLNAYANTYYGARSGQGEAALAAQRQAQMQGVQNFTNFTTGLVTQAIQTENQKQRDILLHTQTMQRAQEQAKLSSQLYADHFAVNNGFLGSESERPWQQMQSAAATAGKSVSEYAGYQQLQNDIMRVTGLAPYQAQAEVGRATALAQAKSLAAHNEQLFEMAEPMEQQELMSLANDRATIMSESSLSPGDRQKMLAENEQRRGQILSQVQSRPRKSPQQVMQESTVYDPNSGMVGIIKGNQLVDMQAARPQNVSPFKQRIDAIVQDAPSFDIATQAIGNMLTFERGGQTYTIDLDGDGNVKGVKPVKGEDSLLRDAYQSFAKAKENAFAFTGKAPSIGEYIRDAVEFNAIEQKALSDPEGFRDWLQSGQAGQSQSGPTPPPSKSRLIPSGDSEVTPKNAMGVRSRAESIGMKNLTDEEKDQAVEAYFILNNMSRLINNGR